MSRLSGRPFLQIPGPTNVPLPVLAAIAKPTIDHRGPEFKVLALEIFSGLAEIIQTRGPVIIYPASGTGAWEAALVNTLSPGDAVLMAETGHFATLWRTIAQKLGLNVQFLPGDWRRGAIAADIEARLAEDRTHAIKAVAVVHNETSTGAVTDIAAVRRAIDAANHPALLLVDTISSLASIDYRHDDWGVDVTVAASQKGLMLPPGLSFNAVSAKARTAARTARLPRAFWDWSDMLVANEKGYFPYTPSTNLLQGLKVAIKLLRDEGLEHVFARHSRMAEAVRCCVRAWGLEIWCTDPNDYSSVLTAVTVPDGVSADALRSDILQRSSVSLGNGLGRLADRVFRIGHLGDFNDPSMLGTLAAIETSLMCCGVPVKAGGVSQAIAALTPLPGATRAAAE
ncbi:MAG: aminotransferase class V-fold PLP-dependent enzyme [Ancalomicrobiaceae bacterium]|nr:aminotransferase class V-fold PLP-dependent enzyme [Ancalomicrobiaceae bacterium]